MDKIRAIAGFGGGGSSSPSPFQMGTLADDTFAANEFNGFITGRRVFTATEAITQFDAVAAMNCTGMGIRITANAAVDDAGMEFRIDSVNVGDNLTIGAGLTGFFSNTTMNRDIAAGERVNVQMTRVSGTGAITAMAISGRFVYD